GAEVLRREVAVGELLDERIDLRRTHLAPAVAVFEPEERLPAVAALLQLRRDRVQPAVDDSPLQVLARLPGVVEDDPVSGLQANVATLQRREAVAAVLLRILLATDAEETAVEQQDGAAEHALLRQALAGDERRRSLPELRQRAREREHRVELLAVAVRAPDRVVQVLPPSGCVGPDRLQVAVGRAADPYVRPRRRNRERANALELDAVAKGRAAVVEVREPAPAALPPVPGLVAVDATEARHGRGIPTARAGQSRGGRACSTRARTVSAFAGAKPSQS